MKSKKNQAQKPDRYLLYGIAIYHMALGVLGFVFKSQAVLLAQKVFYFNLTDTPEIEWIINPLAAYIFIFGVFVWVAASDPLKYRSIVWATFGLFVIRIAQRMYFILMADESLKAIANPMQNVIHLLVVSAIAFWLWKIVTRKA